ncbi:MAG: GHKL domain-containing protein [Flavobacteriales bacterium]|nr:GHKL domain-containing protein [Flavobacteriales bacterium]
MDLRRISVILLILSFKLGLSSGSVELFKEDHNRVIGKYLEVLEDAQDQLSPEQALRSKKYEKKNLKVPNLGFTTRAFWVRFNLENHWADTFFALQINQSLLDKVTLYEYSDKGDLLSETTLGEFSDLNKRPFKDQYLIFNTYLKKKEKKTYLLKIVSGEQILLPLQVSTIQQALERNRNRDILFGIYFGIIFVMMAYNFFLYFSVRDISYLYYVVYIFFVGFAQACLEGYTLKYMWPDNFWIASRSVYFATSLVCVSSILFMRNFLHTKEYTPKLEILFRFIYISFILCVIANSIVVNKFTHNLTQIAVGLVSFTLLFTSLNVYRKGYRPAKYFLIAWIVLIVGVFIFVLKDAGIIEANVLTTYTMQIGSAIEVILLSLALADRINILKKEKEETQAEILRITSEQNVILEEKVKQRTLELEHMNEELEVTLQHLKETESQLLMVEKMASLGQLTAGIAHEINNPINFVSANIKPLGMDIADLLDVLRKYEEISVSPDIFNSKIEEINSFKEEIDLPYLQEEIKTLLSGIEDGAKRTAEIVKGLKNFSHLDESDIKMANINSGIESTLVLLRSSIPPNINIELHLGEIPEIECYPGKLNQVFMNIMNNAVQAMEKIPDRKDHTLSIRSFLFENLVAVSFEDTGIGMTKEVKDKIFDPFFTTKDVGEGTGLGMSIVFGIIESHKGRIEIESEPGKGAKFTLYLPLMMARTANKEVVNVEEN